MDRETGYYSVLEPKPNIGCNGIEGEISLDEERVVHAGLRTSVVSASCVARTCWRDWPKEESFLQLGRISYGCLEGLVDSSAAEQLTHAFGPLWIRRACVTCRYFERAEVEQDKLEQLRSLEDSSDGVGHVDRSADLSATVRCQPGIWADTHRSSLQQCMLRWSSRSVLVK